jgi:hypothetical protein
MNGLSRFRVYHRNIALDIVNLIGCLRVGESFFGVILATDVVDCLRKCHILCTQTKNDYSAVAFGIQKTGALGYSDGR